MAFGRLQFLSIVLILCSIPIPSFSQTHTVNVGDTALVKSVEIRTYLPGLHWDLQFFTLTATHTNDNFILDYQENSIRIKIYGAPRSAGTHNDTLTIDAYYTDSFGGQARDTTYSYVVTMEALDSLESRVQFSNSESVAVAVEGNKVILNEPDPQFVGMELVDLLGRNIASSASNILSLRGYSTGPHFLIIRYVDRLIIKKVFLD